MAGTRGNLVVGMLDAEQIPSYLVAKGLVEREVVDAGRLRILDTSGRHRVHVVAGERCPGFVVKQANAAGGASLAHEARALWTLRRGGRKSGLSPFLPVVLVYDTTERLLVLGLARGAEELARYHARGRFSVTLGRALGRALGLLHRLPPAVVSLPPDVEPEWALSLHRPRLEVLPELSLASMELIRLVQSSSELCERLDELREGWRATSVIHGDLRWENCLAVARPGATRKTRIVLIDWEAAGGGDPGFDLAALFAEYLHAWVQSIPLTSTEEPFRVARQARLPLRRMRPSLCQLWAGYLSASPPAATIKRRILRRAVAFTAARLLQSALERAQEAPVLSMDMVVEVQLALNILRRPAQAAERLLGLS